MLFPESGGRAGAATRFHWASGARVALRANAIIVAAVVFVLGSAPEALATLRGFVLGVVAADYPFGPRVMLAAVCTALAGSGVPRVTLGSTSWMRSLPIDAVAARRAAVAALFLAQLAVAIFVPVAAAASVLVYHSPLSVSKLLSLPLMMLAIAMAMLPVQRGSARVIALLGAFAAVDGSGAGVVASATLIAASDAIAGGIAATRRKRGRRRRGHGARKLPSATSMWLRASWRAMGVSRALECLIVPLVAIAFAYFIIRNNPDLSAGTIARVARVGGAVALATLVAGLANALLRTRQPWSWSRSLPWSASHRVLADACVLAVPMFFVSLALLPLGVGTALVVAALIPTVTLLGASALRAGAKRQTGAAGEALVASLLIGVPAALWSPAAFVALALAPMVLRWGASRERSVHATRWVELHHDASGDPAWLTSP